MAAIYEYYSQVVASPVAVPVSQLSDGQIQVTAPATAQAPHAVANYITGLIASPTASSAMAVIGTNTNIAAAVSSWQVQHTGYGWQPGDWKSDVDVTPVINAVIATQAPGVQKMISSINEQINSFDTTSITAAPETTTSSAAQTSTSSTATAGSAASSGGLAEGAKIGIGVGVGIGVPVLIALILALFFCCRKRGSKGAAAGDSDVEPSQPMAQTDGPIAGAALGGSAHDPNASGSGSGSAASGYGPGGNNTGVGAGASGAGNNANTGFGGPASGGYGHTLNAAPGSGASAFGAAGTGPGASTIAGGALVGAAGDAAAGSAFGHGKGNNATHFDGTRSGAGAPASGTHTGIAGAGAGAPNGGGGATGATGSSFGPAGYGNAANGNIATGHGSSGVADPNASELVGNGITGALAGAGAGAALHHHKNATHPDGSHSGNTAGGSGVTYRTLDPRASEPGASGYGGLESGPSSKIAGPHGGQAGMAPSGFAYGQSGPSNTADSSVSRVQTDGAGNATGAPGYTSGKGYTSTAPGLVGAAHPANDPTLGKAHSQPSGDNTQSPRTPTSGAPGIISAGIVGAGAGAASHHGLQSRPGSDHQFNSGAAGRGNVNGSYPTGSEHGSSTTPGYTGRGQNSNYAGGHDGITRDPTTIGSSGIAPGKIASNGYAHPQANFVSSPDQPHVYGSGTGPVNNNGWNTGNAGPASFNNGYVNHASSNPVSAPIEDENSQDLDPYGVDARTEHYNTWKSGRASGPVYPHQSMPGRDSMMQGQRSSTNGSHADTAFNSNGTSGWDHATRASSNYGIDSFGEGSTHRYSAIARSKSPAAELLAMGGWTGPAIGEPATTTSGSTAGPRATSADEPVRDFTTYTPDRMASNVTHMSNGQYPGTSHMASVGAPSPAPGGSSTSYYQNGAPGVSQGRVMHTGHPSPSYEYGTASSGQYVDVGTNGPAQRSTMDTANRVVGAPVGASSEGVERVYSIQRGPNAVSSVSTQAGFGQGSSSQGTYIQGASTYGASSHGTSTQGTYTQGASTHGTSTHGDRSTISAPTSAPSGLLSGFSLFGTDGVPDVVTSATHNETLPIAIPDTPSKSSEVAYNGASRGFSSTDNSALQPGTGSVSSSNPSQPPFSGVRSGVSSTVGSVPSSYESGYIVSSSDNHSKLSGNTIVREAPGNIQKQSSLPHAFASTPVVAAGIVNGGNTGSNRMDFVPNTTAAAQSGNTGAREILPSKLASSSSQPAQPPANTASDSSSKTPGDRRSVAQSSRESATGSVHSSSGSDRESWYTRTSSMSDPATFSGPLTSHKVATADARIPESASLVTSAENGSSGVGGYSRHSSALQPSGYSGAQAANTVGTVVPTVPGDASGMNPQTRHSASDVDGTQYVQYRTPQISGAGLSAGNISTNVGDVSQNLHGHDLHGHDLHSHLTRTSDQNDKSGNSLGQQTASTIADRVTSEHSETLPQLKREVVVTSNNVGMSSSVPHASTTQASTSHSSSVPIPAVQGQIEQTFNAHGAARSAAQGLENGQHGFVQSGSSARGGDVSGGPYVTKVEVGSDGAAGSNQHYAQTDGPQSVTSTHLRGNGEGANFGRAGETQLAHESEGDSSSPAELLMRIKKSLDAQKVASQNRGLDSKPDPSVPSSLELMNMPSDADLAKMGFFDHINTHTSGFHGDVRNIVLQSGGLYAHPESSSSNPEQPLALHGQAKVSAKSGAFGSPDASTTAVWSQTRGTQPGQEASDLSSEQITALHGQSGSDANAPSPAPLNGSGSVFTRRVISSEGHAGPGSESWQTISSVPYQVSNLQRGVGMGAEDVSRSGQLHVSAGHQGSNGSTSGSHSETEGRNSQFNGSHYQVHTLKDGKIIVSEVSQPRFSSNQHLDAIQRELHGSGDSVTHFHETSGATGDSDRVRQVISQLQSQDDSSSAATSRSVITKNGTTIISGGSQGFTSTKIVTSSSGGFEGFLDELNEDATEGKLTTTTMTEVRGSGAAEPIADDDLFA